MLSQGSEFLFEVSKAKLILASKSLCIALQMFAGIYRDFAGKLECGDFKFTGIACIPTIPVIFEVNLYRV